MKFETVTYDQFKKDIGNFAIRPNNDKWEIEDIYNSIKIPRRATTGSAGYDFYMPFKVFIEPKTAVTIPTGIKVELDKSKVLEIYPRSGLGFKHGMRLMNTVGIIDADYYNNESNEGHIMIKIYNPSDVTLELAAGSAFAQGIIKEYFLVDDDEPRIKTRTGGMGSTDAK